MPKSTFTCLRKICSWIANRDARCVTDQRLQNLISNLYRIDLDAEVRAQLMIGSDEKLFCYDARRISRENLDALWKWILDEDCYGLSEIREDTPHLIDIGSHLGVLPYAFLTRFPNGYVTIVEPDSVSFEIAVKNVKSVDASNESRLLAIQKAVAPQKGTATLAKSSRVDWRSTLDLNPEFLKRPVFDTGEWFQREKVELITLAEVLQAHSKNTVSLLKITIPGSIEADVVSSSLDSIDLLNPNRIAIDIYPENEVKVLTELKSIGYRPVRRVRQSISIFSRS